MWSTHLTLFNARICAWLYHEDIWLGSCQSCVVHSGVSGRYKDWLFFRDFSDGIVALKILREKDKSVSIENKKKKVRKNWAIVHEIVLKNLSSFVNWLKKYSPNDIVTKFLLIF